MEKQVVVSYSTKKRLSNKDLNMITEINEILNESSGFIKVGISITNINSIALYEKGCAGFEDRIENLLRLAESSIPTGVNIKPILPFISLDEYLRIVEHTIKYCDRFMLGDLYIDESTSFGKSVLSEYPGFITTKSIDWLNKDLKVKVYSEGEKKHKIQKSILSKGGKFFESDLSLINDIIKYGN
ncbi:hypothetical protein SAMN04488051_101659 [Alkalimonas amylolytica]|uniref:Uncharacterized protein n=1 Tax=Alkalimonas amylolytica TaxID=152573 RepID=A0A1H3YET6_ALKAM|nr:hypothetical protein SAMN04488051_101659 [Alkalimonas amylolytica]